MKNTTITFTEEEMKVLRRALNLAFTYEHHLMVNSDSYESMKHKALRDAIGELQDKKVGFPY